MKWNFKNELIRKFVHLLSLFILFVYFLASDIFNPDIALIILTFILIIFLELEYLRLELGNKIPVLRIVWSKIRREKEKKKLGSEIFFLVGAILVLAVFDLRIAVAAILMTTFGDMAAALIGSRFGKNYLSYPEDTAWEGILAELFVNIIIGMIVFFFVSGTPLSELNYWILILVMSITATVVETFAGKIDDNLLIPVFAGFNGQIALLILGWF